MKKRLFIGGALVVAVAAAASAWAAIPGSNGVINACYVKNVGLLRVIDAEAGKRCAQFETPLAWNAQGVPGISGYQVMKVTGTQTTDLVGLYRMDVDVRCPSGKKAVGGGGFGFVEGGNNKFVGYAHVLASSPLDDGSGWHLGLGTPTGASFTQFTDVLEYSSYAVCVHVSG